MAINLNGQARTDLRKSALRQLRNDGGIPGVVYGTNTNGEPISVESIEMTKLIRDNGRNGIFSLNIGNKNHQVMITDIQRDSLKGDILHIDFFEIDMNSEIDTEVPIRLVGDSPAIKEGGVVSQLVHQLSIRCLPSDIPEIVEIDISELNIGQSIQVGEIKGVPKVTITNDPEETIVTVLIAAAEEEPGQGQEDAEEAEHVEEAKAEAEERELVEQK